MQVFTEFSLLNEVNQICNPAGAEPIRRHQQKKWWMRLTGCTHQQQKHIGNIKSSPFLDWLPAVPGTSHLHGTDGPAKASSKVELPELPLSLDGLVVIVILV